MAATLEKNLDKIKTRARSILDRIEELEAQYHSLDNREATNIFNSLGVNPEENLKEALNEVNQLRNELDELLEEIKSFRFNSDYEQIYEIIDHATKRIQSTENNVLYILRACYLRKLLDSSSRLLAPDEQVEGNSEKSLEERYLVNYIELAESELDDFLKKKSDMACKATNPFNLFKLLSDLYIAEVQCFTPLHTPIFAKHIRTYLGNIASNPNIINYSENLDKDKEFRTAIKNLYQEINYGSEIDEFYKNLICLLLNQEKPGSRRSTTLLFNLIASLYEWFPYKYPVTYFLFELRDRGDKLAIRKTLEYFFKKCKEDIKNTIIESKDYLEDKNNIDDTIKEIEKQTLPEGLIGICNFSIGMIFKRDTDAKQRIAQISRLLYAIDSIRVSNKISLQPVSYSSNNSIENKNYKTIVFLGNNETDEDVKNLFSKVVGNSANNTKYAQKEEIETNEGRKITLLSRHVDVDARDDYGLILNKRNDCYIFSVDLNLKSDQFTEELNKFVNFVYRSIYSYEKYDDLLTTPNIVITALHRNLENDSDHEKTAKENLETLKSFSELWGCKFLSIDCLKPENTEELRASILSTLGITKLDLQPLLTSLKNSIIGCIDKFPWKSKRYRALTSATELKKNPENATTLQDITHFFWKFAIEYTYPNIETSEEAKREVIDIIEQLEAIDSKFHGEENYSSFFKRKGNTTTNHIYNVKESLLHLLFPKEEENNKSLKPSEPEEISSSNLSNESSIQDQEKKQQCWIS